MRGGGHRVSGLRGWRGSGRWVAVRRGVCLVTPLRRGGLADEVCVV